MSRRAGISGALAEGRGCMAVIRGETVAHAVLRNIRSGTAQPDALALALAALRQDPDAHRGFARAVQKALERCGDCR